MLRVDVTIPGLTLGDANKINGIAEKFWDNMIIWEFVVDPFQHGDVTSLVDSSNPGRPGPVSGGAMAQGI